MPNNITQTLSSNIPVESTTPKQNTESFNLQNIVDAYNTSKEKITKGQSTSKQITNIINHFKKLKNNTFLEDISNHKYLTAALVNKIGMVPLLKHLENKKRKGKYLTELTNSLNIVSSDNEKRDSSTNSLGRMLEGAKELLINQPKLRDHLITGGSYVTLKPLLKRLIKTIGLPKSIPNNALTRFPAVYSIASSGKKGIIDIYKGLYKPKKFNQQVDNYLDISNNPKMTQGPSDYLDVMSRLLSLGKDVAVAPGNVIRTAAFQKDPTKAFKVLNNKIYNTSTLKGVFQPYNPHVNYNPYGDPIKNSIENVPKNIRKDARKAYMRKPTTWGILKNMVAGKDTPRYDAYIKDLEQPTTPVEISLSKAKRKYQNKKSQEKRRAISDAAYGMLNAGMY